MLATTELPRGCLQARCTQGWKKWKTLCCYQERKRKYRFSPNRLSLAHLGKLLINCDSFPVKRKCVRLQKFKRIKLRVILTEDNKRPFPQVFFIESSLYYLQSEWKLSLLHLFWHKSGWNIRRCCKLMRKSPIFDLKLWFSTSGTLRQRSPNIPAWQTGNGGGSRWRGDGSMCACAYHFHKCSFACAHMHTCPPLPQPGTRQRTWGWGLLL